ncbi:MAG: sodium:calcium antiporter [Actinomycetota bacterium]|nr:sodium:calcium antiporter [Actinomycetota bacterium]
MLLDVLRIIGGLIALIYAADRLAKSAVRISRAFGVSVIFIGAVVVGFGTSVPEFVVSALAALEGELDLAVGNVASSNISNVTLVLGAAALITPIAARRRVIKREGALMFASVAVLAALLANGWLDAWEGFLLMGLLGVAIWLMIRWSSEDPDAVLDQIDDEDTSTGTARVTDLAFWREEVGKEILIGVGALIVTIIAADFLLDGVIGVGVHFGLSTLFLGLITGVGTSLPELAAGIAAARNREPELVLGNILGSNIFNSLGVVGLAAVLGPGELTVIDLPLLAMMVGVVFVAGVFALTGKRINRIEGGILLIAFTAFVVYAFV